MLGKVYFQGPSALLNGLWLWEAQGVERRANTARVMGAACTWVIPAKNICIEGAEAPQMKASTKWHAAGVAETALHMFIWWFILLLLLASSVAFLLSEFHDPQAFET